MALASASFTLIKVDDGSGWDRQYAVNTSGTTAPTMGWTATRPAPQAGKYIWMRERTANADGTYGAWETPVCLTGDKGETGEQGATGPQGPAGTPGFLGVNVSGTTIQVRGFDANGAFTAPTGKIYYRGFCCDVLANSYAPSPTGEGWILVDTTTPSSCTVEFRKLQPQSSGGNGAVMQWVDYNTGTVPSSFLNRCVIGKFSRSAGGVVTAELVDIQSTSELLNNRFMQILATAETSTEVTLNTWAKAMGCEKVFDRVAMLEAFVNKLFANKIELLGSMFSFGYSKGDIDKTDKRGFYFDAEGYSEWQFMRAKNASIEGQFTAQDAEGVVLKTQPGGEANAIACSPKSRWDINLLIKVVNNSWIVCTKNGTQLILYRSIYDGFAPRTGGYLPLYDGGGDLNYLPTNLRHFTIQEDGEYFIGVNARSFSPNIKINDSTVASGVAYQNSWSGKLKHGDDVFYFANHATISLKVFDEPFLYQTRETVVYEPNPNPDGLYKVELYSDYTGIIPPGTKLDWDLQVDTRFNSADYLDYAPVTGWYDNIPMNRTVDARSDSAVTIDGVSKTVAYVTKTPGSLLLAFTDYTSVTLSAPADTADVATVGWHDISGTIYTQAEARGVVVDNLIPSADAAKNIGSGMLKFNTIHAINVNGNVNAPGTANKVYGAVFN